MNPHIFKTVDVGVFAVANLINLFLAVMFAARGRRDQRLEKGAGLAVVLSAFPLVAASVLNAVGHRSGWTWGLPLFMIAFCVVEYLLDYALKINFRNSRAVRPYLILFYLALLALIGYSFLLGKTYGYATLATYFLQLGATAYSYGRVKHGG